MPENQSFKRTFGPHLPALLCCSISVRCGPTAALPDALFRAPLMAGVRPPTTTNQLCPPQL